MVYDVELINTGTIVADYLKEYLKEKNIENIEKKEKEIVFLSKPEEEFKKIAKNIIKTEIEIVQLKQ